MARIHKRGHGRGRPSTSNATHQKTFQGGGQRGDHGKASSGNHSIQSRGGGSRGGNRRGENRSNRSPHSPYRTHQDHHTKANNYHLNAPRHTDSLDAQLDHIIHAGKAAIPLDDLNEEDDTERFKSNKAVLMTAAINLATHLLRHQNKIQNCTCTTQSDLPTTPRTPLNTMVNQIDINSFLGYIKMAVDKGDQQMIRSTLQVEPPRDEGYAILQEELLKKYPPSGNGRPNTKLRKKCQDVLQQGQPHPWQNLPDVVLAYLEFLRREKEDQLTIKEIQSDIDGILRFDAPYLLAALSS